ncbi:MAG: hypothetical protein NVSMB27_29330 [Ktedonobacteraceae bacterium]
MTPLGAFLAPIYTYHFFFSSRLLLSVQKAGLDMLTPCREFLLLYVLYALGPFLVAS